MQENENAIFSAPNQDRRLILSVHIPLIYEHIFNKLFVRRSVSQATKAKNIRIWKCNFLGPK